MVHFVWLVVGVVLCINTASGVTPEVLESRVADSRHKRRALLVPDTDNGDDPVRPEGEDKLEPKEQVKQHVMRTFRKTSRMSPSQMFLDDAAKMLDNFMPGQRPRVTWGIPGVACLVGVAWMIFYMCVIYKNDREEHMDHWKLRERSPREEDPRIEDIKPDFILLFHHPNHTETDKDSVVKKSTVQTCLVQETHSGYLKRVETCMSKAEEPTTSSHLHKLIRHAQSFRSPRQDLAEGGQDGKQAMSEGGQDGKQAKFSSSEGEADADEEATPREEVTMTLGEVREALLQDICTALPQSGFEIVSFSSIDDDEIFVGVSLENPDIIRDELIRAGLKLQLQQAVVQKLGIGQDPAARESSPPYIKYDARIAKNILGPEATDQNVYVTSHGKHNHGSIISSTQRIRLIYRHLSRHIDLDNAVSNKILKDWYPVHSRHWVTELNATWASLELLKDFSFVQPMTYVHNYFGSRVAFTFAWNGLYCKMLLALLPIALLFQSIYMLGHWEGHVFRGMVIFFSLVLVIWSKMASNLWEREQEYFKLLWDLNDAPEYATRPDFKGTLESMPEDSTKKSLQYPRHKYMLRQAVMWTFTIAFCLLDFACVYVWINVFEGRLDLVASICLALIVQVFTQIYNPVVDLMTKHENHKYQNDFYNSYLMKQFIFQFVNQFCAYFFIAVKQQHTSYGCPNGDCMGLLRKQLSMTLCVLVAMRIFQVALSSTKVSIMLWWERRALEKELEGTDEELPVCGFVEEQAKYEDFRIRQQIEGMVQLVIALGYILIFGAVAPTIVPLCFINFAVHFRATAFMTTRSSRRPLPRRSVGLGAWQAVVTFLQYFGVVFSGFLVVSHGPSFANTYLITRVSGLMVYVALIAGVWTIVSLAMPPTSHGAKLLEARRRYVVDNVNKANEEANIAHLKLESNQFVKEELENHSAEYTKEILSASYGEVPHLVDVNSSTTKLRRTTSRV